MGEVLFEFKRVGNVIRASAMDADTLTEVTVVAPLGANPTHLKTVAMRKLKYVLEKSAGKS